MMLACEVWGVEYDGLSGWEGLERERGEDTVLGLQDFLVWSVLMGGEGEDSAVIAYCSSCQIRAVINLL
jgi:hypothetical protein